ncbi:MAG: thiosulfate oxidation carrier complex protein SoxZ [bacterium]|nr:thiosulfate oxidation carrier complex protein SoxZ [Gammaproteobacteria bacterium]HIL96993.1 thiosulfate oxidation carrier complex protein SoxZ [Pseudomonadales bacterium]
MAAKPVKIRARAKDGLAKIKCLMPHPMETGTRRDAAGNLIAAHYIETVTCKHNDTEVLTAQWGPSVSKDPYLSFKVKGANSGDRISVSWVDNLGETSSGEMILK